MLPTRSARCLHKILIVFYITTISLPLSLSLSLSLFLYLSIYLSIYLSLSSSRRRIKDDEDTLRMSNGDGARVSGSREWSLRGLMRRRRVDGKWEGRRDRVHVDRATAAT